MRRSRTRCCERRSRDRRVRGAVVPAVQGDRAGARRDRRRRARASVRLVKLDIDTNLGTPSRYGVLSVPTVILFVAGEARETLVGAARQGPLRARVRAVPRRVTRDGRHGTTWADLLSGEELAFWRPSPARAGTPRAAARRARSRSSRRRSERRHRRPLRHQAEAWEAAGRGENVIVTTGTASGKSLAFNLPVLDAIVRRADLRALYLYPTKALTQDQARGLPASA